MRNVDVPVRGNRLALKCKKQSPHNRNAGEEYDHSAAYNPKFSVGKYPEKEAEKRDLDKVDDDRVA